MICECWSSMYKNVLDVETLANYKYLQQDIAFDNYFKNCSFLTNDTSIAYYDGKIMHNIHYVSRLLNVEKAHLDINDNCKCILLIRLIVFDVRFGFHITFEFEFDITGASHVNGVSAPQRTYDSLECEDIMRIVDRNMFVDLNEQEREENNEEILGLEHLYREVAWLFGYLSGVSEFQWKLANEVQYDCLKHKNLYVPLRFIELFRFYSRHRNTIVRYFTEHCTCGFFYDNRKLHKCCSCKDNREFNNSLISRISW